MLGIKGRLIVIATRKQIRDAVLDATSQLPKQKGSMVEDFINVTMQEVGSPSWAFRRERFHLWSWLKRKTTFVASSEDTVISRDVDKIAFLRQTDSPMKIQYMPDELFYTALPNPTETGNPRIYRLWEIQGTSTKLASAATVKVSSSSALDGSTYTVVITGYVSGRFESETITMNGTTEVAGTKTYDSDEIFVSKSGIFNGNLTVKDASDNTLVTIGPEEISPRFKVVSLWPTPSSTTVYMEYYKKIKELNDDSEMPEFDSKFHHIVRIGTMAKMYQHLGKTSDFNVTQNLYARLIRGMVADDDTLPDSIDRLKRHDTRVSSNIRLKLSEETIA